MEAVAPKRPFLKRAIRGVSIRMDEFFLRPVFGVIPRAVFGNNAGFVNNIASPRHLARLQKGFTPSAAAESAAAFRRDHLVGLGYPHSPALTQSLHDRARVVFQDPALYLEQGDPPHESANQLAKNVLTNFPGIEKLLTPEIIRTIENYYGSYFNVVMVRCWRNNHVPGLDTHANIFSNQWHNDQFDTNVLKYFVYLTDGISRDNGAFRAKTKAETSHIMRSFGFFRRSRIYGKAKRLIDDASKTIFMEGNAGFSFLANPTICLHRAGVPASGKHRDIVQYTFLPSDKPLAADWFRTLQTEDRRYL